MTYLENFLPVGKKENLFRLKTRLLLQHHLAQLIELIEKGVVSNNVAKEIFPEMFSSGRSP